MTIREQFKKECCDVVFENHCIGNQVDCDKCYIKYLEQQIEAKDKEIERLKKDDLNDTRICTNMDCEYRDQDI